MVRFLCIALLCGATLPAHSDTARYTRVGVWDVSFYDATRGCQAFAYVNDNTAFFIGFDTTTGADALDVTLVNASWQEIEPDETYSVSLQFGEQPEWTLDMRGISVDDRPGLNIVFPAETPLANQFVQEFQQELHMDWSYGDRALGEFSLRGSSKAFDAVRDCQAKQAAQ